MPRPISHNFLKDDNGSISDHLRSHVHLTNCIHVKNHMHRHSPILAERSLMRDLIVLQRSRSLRDPSTSPPSWHSPSMAGSLVKKLEKDCALHGGRRSLGVEQRRESGGLTGSPRIPSVATSKVSAVEAISDHNARGSVKDPVMGKGEEFSRKFRKSNLSGGTEKPLTSVVSAKVEARDKKVKGTYSQINVPVKTLSQQLQELPNQTDSEDAKSSHFCRHRRHIGQDKITEEPEQSSHDHFNGLKRVKRRRFKGVRRSRPSIDSRDIGGHNDLSVASNSLAQGSMHHRYALGEEGEEAEMDVTRAPRNGCGIPWNWSRIHHRGKSFLDMAGRSISCGRSDSRLSKDEGPVPQCQRDPLDMTIASDHLSASTNSDSEALPLLNEPSGSQESNANPFITCDYSGELEIFANHNLKHERDSDVVSEARSGNHHETRRHHHGRHRSLTQKYMPKTFKDLVGQTLVVQALSNAIVRKKVGLVYVFCGPHGTGKTSCARIFARALNCQSLEHPKPCGVCSFCISYNMGKSRNVLEVGPLRNFDFEGIMDVLENTMLPTLSSQYRVFIVDDCDTLPPDSWSTISKVIDRAPRRMVFLLVTTNIDQLPHIIISRCQKFFFPKLKDADIIYTLQWVATKEGIEIDKDALKLIASQSDGSLRDAEMTLDQLSLLGQRISLTLVQELVGLVSDEKLVDLLDLALSADTVNTVKRLREIMEAGVEPLALMSQLATIITDILAGSYIFTRERLRRKFFRRLTLSKEDMEKLRQALKTLSEAEKQLRMSNDKLTWLTAALLQLAPDQQYMLPSSSADTSFTHSPMLLNNISERYTPGNFTSERNGITNGERGLSRGIGMENHGSRNANDGQHDAGKMNNNVISRMNHVGVTPPQGSVLSTEANGGHNPGKRNKDVEKIWMAVLEKIQINALKQFIHQEGKLISVSFGSAPTVQLMFSSHANKSKAEKFRGHILQAFESVLCSAVTLELRCDSRKDVRPEAQVPHILPASENGSSQMAKKRESVHGKRTLRAGSHSKDNVVKGVGSTPARQLQSNSLEMAKDEIVEIVSSPQNIGLVRQTDNSAHLEEKGLESVWVEEASSLHPLSEKQESEKQPQRQSLVRSKVSLAHVIQQAEGCTQRSGWSRRKAISIAEKLEQENLRLEPRSRSLLCWKTSRITRGKLPLLRIRKRKPHSLLKLVSCGRCLCAKSPR